MNGQAVTGPLQGLKVLDLTAMLAGPYATMLLADLGADVVKIEPPTGDLTRRVGPFRPEAGEGRLGGYFQSVNRGKRSIVLDLKTADGGDRFLELVARADVVAENFSAGVLERLGFGYEVLAEVNPRLVYAAIRGFGDPRTGESPYVSWPAFDVVAQAVGGFLSVTGTADGQPIKSGPGIGDLFEVHGSVTAMFNTTLADQVFNLPQSFLPLIKAGDPTSVSIFASAPGLDGT